MVSNSDENVSAGEWYPLAVIESDVNMYSCGIITGIIGFDSVVNLVNETFIPLPL